MKDHILNNVLILCDNNSKKLIKFLQDQGILNKNVKYSPCRIGKYYGLQDGDFTILSNLDANYEATEGTIRLTNLQSAIEYVNQPRFTQRNAKGWVDQVSESFAKAEEANNMISIHTPKSFPRVMWVGISTNPNHYHKKMVIAYARGKYIAWDSYDGDLEDIDSYETSFYTHALELEELTVLTKEDIAKLANTTVDKLKIID